MGKKSRQTARINTSIVCSYLNSVNFGKPVDGRMLNCCVNGLYAELEAHFKAGTVLVVRTIGQFMRVFRRRGVPFAAVAEVKWSKSKSVRAGAATATGLKYMMI